MSRHVSESKKQAAMIDGWDEFWQQVLAGDRDQSTLWDVDAATAIEDDIARFMPHFDPALPILDLGCGAGRQSFELARHCGSVIGVDKSKAAIKLAQSISPDAAGLTFRVADLLDPDAIQSLHDEFGDLNVYVRGVFHVVRPPMRQQYVSGIEVLLGTTGTLYQIELSWAAARCFQEVPGLQAWRMPEKVRLNAFELSDFKRYFPDDRWRILEQGKASINTAQEADGGQVRFPANYLILRHKKPD